MGYHRAGFDVIGVDIKPQPRYPFRFVRADALEFLADLTDERVVAIHASPPCTGHSTIASVGGFRGSHGTEWLLRATIRLLDTIGLPYAVENVVGADMPGALTLCGSEFGLVAGGYVLRRHRQFSSNVFLLGAGGCAHSGRVIGVYGDLSRNDRCATSRSRRDGRPYRDMRASVETARQIMDIPWANAHELTQAIPPAYTEHIGQQLLDHLAVTS